MKFEMKKSHIAMIGALALCGATAAHADVMISDLGGTTFANIDDAGYFSTPGPVGMSFMGREYVNLGTWSSNYWLNANGAAVATADEVVGSNPLTVTAFGPLGGGTVEVSTNLGVGLPWGFVETVSVPSPGHVAVTVQLTNNTGADAASVQWGVGFDPDQGVPVSLGFGTTNDILALGGDSAVKATSLDGWSVTLHNTTSASAFAIQPFIDVPAPIGLFGTCCSPIDPAIMFAKAQGVGGYGFGDYSINLAYDLGTVLAGHSVTIGYEYIMAVPEPETYAMLLAGLGLIGFSARRRISA